jgi:PKD repeat protein
MKFITHLSGIKALLLCIAVFFATSSLHAQYIFQKLYAAPSGATFGEKGVQTSDGGFIQCGYTEHTFINNQNNQRGSGYNLLVVKTDTIGDTLWSKMYGSGGTNRCYDIVETYDNSYLFTGSTTGFSVGNNRMFLIKINQNGDTLWTRTFYGLEGRSLLQTTDSCIVVLGSSNYHTGSDTDFLLSKLDMNGDTLWTRTYGTPFQDNSTQVKQTTDGGFIMVGFSGTGSNLVYMVKADSAGNMQWAKTYGGSNNSLFDRGNCVEQTTDGGYILTGLTESFGAGNNDIYIIKTDANGDTLWTRAMGTPNDETGHSIIETKDSTYLLTGVIYNSGRSTFLTELTINGDTLWTKIFSSENHTPKHITSTTDGGYVIFCSDENSSQGMYLIKIDSLLRSSCSETPYPLTITSTNTIVANVSATNSGTVMGTVPMNIFTPITTIAITCFDTAGCKTVSANFTTTNYSFLYTFINNSTNGLNWHWDFGDGNTSSSLNVNHSYINEGSYNVCLTAYGNCDSSVYCETINYCENPPNGTSSYTGSNYNYSFNYTPVNTIGWEWDFGDGSPIDTAQNPQHTFPGDGTYIVCLTAYTYCDTVTTCDTISIFISGTENNLLENQISIYPNPTSGIFTLDFGALNQQDVSIAIYQVDGKLVYTQGTAINSVNQQLRINLSPFEKGMYFINIQTTSATTTKRVLVNSGN